VIHIKLLIIMKLYEDGLMHHILPKTEMQEVNEIYIVRDNPGPAMNKVTYVCPPKILPSNPIVLILAKIFISLHLAFSKRPDFIISYAMYPHGIIAFLVAKLSRTPLIISVIHINEMDGYGFFFPQLYISILMRCNIITTTGSKTREKLIIRGISPDKIFLLPHAVDTEKFFPIDTKKMYDILYLGTVSERKHPDIVIKALHQVKKSTKKQIMLCIAGSGSPSYEIYIKQLIQEMDLASNVTFAGFVLDTAATYNMSKIYILPTESEGLPFTVLEAMACGVPVITTNAGDMTDTVKDNINAILVEQWDDVKAFSTGITRLLDDSIFYKKLRENGLEEIFSHHCNNNVISTWEKIFRKIENKNNVI
jgi:glycosyltransferase involved in cell wall biosynthesis